MELAIIADSHIPSRASEVPPAFETRIREADHVIHAGDFDAEGSYSNIDAMAEELTAVVGNMDPLIGLPEVTTVTLGGVEFVITHGTGPPTGYKARVAETARQNATNETTDSPVGVAGHTHEVMDTTHEGIRLLNPGSVTGASPASNATMMVADVEDGSLSVEVLDA